MGTAGLQWSRKMFAAAAFALLAALPTASRAQPAAKVPMVGYLLPFGCEGTALPTLISAGLLSLGWVDGKTVTFVCRHGGGLPERMPAAAAELVQLKPDVIVASTNLAAFPAKQATSTIPIVVWGAHGALETGLVPNLSRPGGNVTGVESLAPEVDAKRLELLKEIVPRLEKVAVLYNPDDRGSPVHLKYTMAAARALGINITTLEVRRAADYDGALQALAQRLPDALLTFTDYLTYFNAKRVADFALQHRLPTMCEFKSMAAEGCLISYGANQAEFTQINVRQIDRILRGAKAGDMPVEQATRYELILNQKTARAHGMAIPQSVQVRANEVIE